MLVNTNGKVEHIKPVPLRTVRSKREIMAAWDRILGSLANNSAKGDWDLLLNDIALISEVVEAA